MGTHLFGGYGLLKVPQFEGTVLAGRDQDGLAGVEGQRAHAVKVAAQRVLGVPRLAERLLVHGYLFGNQISLRQSKKTRPKPT